jgi:hypothetical protein
MKLDQTGNWRAFLSRRGCFLRGEALLEPGGSSVSFGLDPFSVLEEKFKKASASRSDAFIFCQGGFHQLDMTFDQFLLVAATINPADLPATHEEARTF